LDDVASKIGRALRSGDKRDGCSIFYRSDRFICDGFEVRWCSFNR